MTNRIRRFAFLTSLLMAGIVGGTSAQAAQPWVSVPSTAQNGQLVVNGGDLVPGIALTVKITHPDGVVTSQVVASSAAGKMNLLYPLGMPGSYSVKVYDMAGKLIGGGVMGHIR